MCLLGFAGLFLCGLAIRYLKIKSEENKEILYLLTFALWVNAVFFTVVYQFNF
jgi:hypothetical protein